MKDETDGNGLRLRPAKEWAALPRLTLWKKDVAAMLGLTVRTLERMIASCEIPAPDLRLRGRCAWRPATIQEWVEKGCPCAGRNLS